MSRFSQILGKAQAYATRNPDKVANIAGKAGDFVNKRTKGKYAAQIDGALNKVDAFAGKQRPRRDGEAGTRGGGSW